MIENNQKINKFASTYIGPFIVERRTKGGSYVLKDKEGNRFKRRVAPSQMKLIKIHKDGKVNREEADVDSN